VRREVDEQADGEPGEAEGEIEFGNDDDSLATPGAHAIRAAAPPPGPAATVVLGAPHAATVVALQPPGSQPSGSFAPAPAPAVRPDAVECAAVEHEGTDTLRFKLVVIANSARPAPLACAYV
jgi:hypothetical protein